jgi:hypothetical protein
MRLAAPTSLISSTIAGGQSSLPSICLPRVAAISAAAAHGTQGGVEAGPTFSTCACPLLRSHRAHWPRSLPTRVRTRPGRHRRKVEERAVHRWPGGHYLVEGSQSRVYAMGSPRRDVRTPTRAAYEWWLGLVRCGVLNVATSADDEFNTSGSPSVLLRASIFPSSNNSSLSLLVITERTKDSSAPAAAPSTKIPATVTESTLISLFILLPVQLLWFHKRILVWILPE